MFTLGHQSKVYATLSKASNGPTCLQMQAIFPLLGSSDPKRLLLKNPPAQTIAPPTPPWLLLPGYSTSPPPSCWLAGWLRVGGTSIRLTKIVVDPSPPVGKEDVKLLDHPLHDDVWMGDQPVGKEDVKLLDHLLHDDVWMGATNPRLAITSISLRAPPAQMVKERTSICFLLPF